MPPRRSVGRRPAPGSPRSGLSQATSRARRAPRHISWPIWAGIGALVAYGWWFINRQPFSGGALLALFGAAAGVIALSSAYRATAERSGRDEATAHAPALRRSIVVWSVTVTALAAWELIALFSHPRSDHPTISSLLATAMEHQGPRFAVYLLWIWLGWAIAS